MSRGYVQEETRKIIFTHRVKVVDSCISRWRVITDGSNLDPLRQLALAGDATYNYEYEESGILQICEQHRACFSIMEGCPRGGRVLKIGDEAELYAGTAKAIVEKGWARLWES